MQNDITKVCFHFLLFVIWLPRVSSFIPKTSPRAPVSTFSLNMGLLKVGVPKSWDDAKPHLEYVRKAGIRQFVSTYNRVKDLKGDELLWGDEIEYGIFQLDPETKKIRLSLRAKDVS
mmetsp:Transcript_25100/g.69237  ORF Transcript_25100/g.69237 Transcript_25100/m.69237 type:complete len:117 (+) Transcript_25100:223-573(+)